MTDLKSAIEKEKHRRAFRLFAMKNPQEAADLDWPELFAMCRDIDPDITEDEVRRILKRHGGDNDRPEKAD